MKLTELLIVTCCSIIAARSETTETNQKELLKRASEQLERLAPYRRIITDQGTPDLSNLLEIWKSMVDRNDLDGTKSDIEQSIPWEIFEVLPEQAQSDVSKENQNDDEKQIMIGIVADPKYTELMQERIKRGFNGGSASLLTGIAGGVIHGLASASSSSAGKASASSTHPVYEAPPAYGSPLPDHSYGEKPFGPWDFKKAIFGTVFQALKAIGGGVLALKGQLIKGSGYLLAAKGKVVSKAGDVITSFGKQITSSVTGYQKPYATETYVYDEHLPAQHIEHDVSYHGPPNPHSYTDANGYNQHSVYGVPSDDNNQGGLLIVKPTKSDLDEHGDQHANIVEEKPDLTKLEESFGGPTKGSFINDFFSSIPKGSGGLTDHQAVSQENYNTNQNPHSSPPLEHPPPTYDAPDHYNANHDNPPVQNNENYPMNLNYENYPVNQNNENYVINQNNENYSVDQNNENYPVNQNNENYPITQNNIHYQPEPPLTHNFPNPIDDHHHHYHHLTIQPSVEYPPLHVQQFEHPAHPHGSLTSPLLNTPKLPNDDSPSVYASLTVDTEPQLAPLKIPLLGYPGAFDLPKLQPNVDFHGQHFGLHNSLDDPLRIQLLNPSSGLPAHSWYGQGWATPVSGFGTLNSFRKRNVLRKMIANRVARYSSSQATRLHRL